INGQPVKLDSYKGKVILINYWATWCPPCVAEIPELIALQKKYAGKLQIIGISLDDDPSAARRFAAQTKFNYPVVMANDELKSKYGRILSIPTTIVINKNMMVVQVETGYRNPQFFEELVKRHSK
ncbi:TlpA family protein disulfide reductase, partial [bacterium]|nr:TlpA family protein disulfide reductase [bacterium]